MRAKFFLSVLLNSILISFIANSYVLKEMLHWNNFIITTVLFMVIVFAGTFITYVENMRLLVCQHGTILLYSFYVSLIVSIIFQINLAFKTIPDHFMTFIWSVLVCFAVNFIVFWVGIICVYATSIQLGLKWRIIGLACGMIPIANLVALFFILKTTTTEFLVESEKIKINKQRENQKVCATKYPVLLVHGVFFRDSKFFNYWGRIPKELESNGAKVFYGNHSSALSIADSATELKARITDILAETGAEKVNIIAHSKGGLDSRYAIAKLGMGDYVASLTTINTPHRGCLYADYLLTKIPTNTKNKIANTYNSTLKKFGEPDSDFLSAVSDLTDSRCNLLNEEMPTPKEIYCQSVGSVLAKATHGQFPLNLSYHLVKHFGGENDGLVSEDSFAWGQKYTLLKTKSNRGISHGDMVDLNRENITGFDVREFYVSLVNDLKNRGL